VLIVRESGNPDGFDAGRWVAGLVDAPSEVVIHRRDGSIRDSDSYRRDPNPSTDTKH